MAGRSVASLHQDVKAMLASAGHALHLHGAPNEVEPAIPFDEDVAPRDYDPDSARRLLGALLSADRVLRLFRSSFLGKVSPVHFFWGGFDLAVTRFSGRPAPPHPGGIPHLPDAITREAYSHEVSSAGFWPGSAGGTLDPFFYSYAYPAPEGFADARIEPELRPLRRGFRRIHARLRGRARPPPIPTPLCSPSSNPPMRPPPISPAGTAPRLEGPRGRPHVPRPV